MGRSKQLRIILIVKPYLVATFLVWAAYAIKLMTPAQILAEIPFLIFFSAVVISGIYGGFAVGIYATFLSAFFASYFFIPPTHTLIKQNWHQDLKLAIFIIDSATIAGLCGRLKDALQEAKKSREEALASREAANEALINLQKTQAELIESRQVAVQANAAKSIFLANMSHEIRTPLGVIQGFADILHDAPGIDGENRKMVSTIRRNTNQLTSIIGEILDLSKIEANKLEIETIDFSLREFLEDVRSVLAFEAEKKGIVFRLINESTGSNAVSSDPTRLRQILINLGGNAIKFTQKGSVQMTVNRRDECLTVVVEDTGVGIDSVAMGRLFQPFVQADASTTRKFGGTGLGLYISKRIAEALGGTLDLVRTAPGAGSTFKLNIPLKQAAQKPSHRPIDRGAESGRLKDVHVLLVEDSVDNQELLSRFLKKEGASLELAGNGRDGVTIALSGQFDVVLMDIQMPELDGWEAIRELRSKGYTKPVAALTAHAMKEERDKAALYGFDDYVTKPVNREILVSTIERLSGKSS